MTHPQVYSPEMDTYLLLECALQEVRPGDRVLEVGTGSGYIASRLMGKAHVVATDINPYAVREARDLGVDVVRTDLVDGLCGQFEMILFNPPYLPTQPEERISDWLEHALDGGVSGREVITRFAGQVGRVLAHGGRILLLISSLTCIHEVEMIFRNLGYEVRIARERDVFEETLLVLKITRKE
jgi:release factor glutamine methyltransferase